MILLGLLLWNSLRYFLCFSVQREWGSFSLVTDAPFPLYVAAMVCLCNSSIDSAYSKSFSPVEGAVSRFPWCIITLLNLYLKLQNFFCPFSLISRSIFIHFFLTNRILVLIRYTRLVVVLGHVQSAYLITWCLMHRPKFTMIWNTCKHPYRDFLLELSEIQNNTVLACHIKIYSTGSGWLVALLAAMLCHSSILCHELKYALTLPYLHLLAQ